MEVKIEIKVKPFRVPSFVFAEKNSADPSDDTKFALADLDSATLDRLCNKFRREVFEKASKPDPKSNTK